MHACKKIPLEKNFQRDSEQLWHEGEMYGTSSNLRNVTLMISTPPRHRIMKSDLQEAHDLLLLLNNMFYTV